MSEGTGGKGLRRSNSSGSLTTRTFRDQSPNYQSSDKGSQDVPPVPPLPQSYPKETPHRRTSSLEPAYRTSSSQPKHSGGRGGSLDRSIGQIPPGSPTPRYPSLHSVPEAERPGSRGSINFSYPINSPSNSPRQSPVERHPNNTILVNGFANREQSGDSPAKKNKKKKAVSHPPTKEALPSTDTAKSPRNVPSDAQGVSQPKEEVQPSDSHTVRYALSTDDTGATPKKKKKKKKKNVEQVSHETTSDTYGPNRDRNSEIGGSHQGGNATLRPGPTPKKRPSIVREDPEGEKREEVEENSPTQYMAGLSSARDVELTTQSNKGPLQNISNEVAHHTAQSSVEPPAGPTRRHGEPVQGKQPVDSQNERQHSLSPTRSTRFSSRLAVSGATHNPPPRSVSPAKSALKAPHPPHALPPDVSSNWPKPSKTQSETSEGTSVTSEDGSRIGSKKRAVKVSFEDEAEIVGTAASPPTSPESSAPLSPLGKSTMPRSQWDDDEYGYGEVMKPRPALPSFGSVRGGRREEVVEEDPSNDLPSDASSIASSASNLATVGTSLSSDHALGPMLAAEKKRTTVKEPPASDLATKVNEPLPPQVTSIDGTGFGSDSDVEVPHDSGPNSSVQSRSSSHKPIDPITPQNGETESNQSTPSSSNNDIKTRQNGSIPHISVLPATPALEEERDFPTSSGQVDQPREAPENFTVSEEAAITKPVAATNQGPSDPVSPEQSSPVENSGNESDTSDESIYSDAAEDLSDLDGDGFGSINAIVESPVNRVSNISPRTPPESPTQSSFSQIKGSQSPTQQKTADVPGQAPPELLPSVLPIVEEEPSPSVEPKEKNKRAASKQPEQSALLHTGLNKDHTAPKVLSVESSPKVRRPAPEEYDVACSQPFHHANGKLPSMPGTAMGSSSKTAPATQSKATLKKNTRPTSSGPLSQASAASAAASQAPVSRTSFPQGLQRTLSNGSDSSSSFKRSKRPSKPEGQYTMRRTMRAGSGSGRPWSQDGKGGNNSIRSLSPQGKRPFSSGSNGSMMRMTLRGPSNSNTNKLNDGKQAKSSTFPILGKSASLKKAPGKSNAKFNLRFENPSDEDVSRVKDFQSRFEDSSDDEVEMEKFRPVRGIPRRKDTDDGDSTDLEDSSDDETGRVIRRGSRRRSAVTPAPITGTAISTTAAVAASKAETSTDRKHASEADGANHELEHFLPGKKEKKKPSLFHRLTFSKRGRNKESGINKSQLDSAARRDTSLERSRVELERMRLAKLLANEQPHENVQTTITGGDTTEQHGLKPPTSKLRKKSAGGGTTNNNINEQAISGSWPLRAPPPEFHSPPEPIPEKTDDTLNQGPSTPPATEDRPHTSDGIVKEDTKPTLPPINNTGSPSSAESSWASRFRPRLSRRQGTDSTHDNSSIATSDAGGSSPTAVGDVVVDKGGRRKKFPLLRRALGIGN